MEALLINETTCYSNIEMKCRWSIQDLQQAVRTSTSIRQVLQKLGLREAGGNYTHIQKYISEHHLDIGHFHGKGWRKGLQIPRKPVILIKDILVKDSSFQSYRLKRRLFKEGYKKAVCEECGWSEQSPNGRVPLELDHINGDRRDNRIENLRILCPNCHSLKPTHRGRNIKARRGGGTGRHATLKML